MGLKLVTILLSTLMFFYSTTAEDFDITNAKYGGKADSDVFEALDKAWKDACAATSASKIVVPKGTYKLKEGYFKGPCKGAIEFQLQGTLKAPEDANLLTKKDTWIEFSYLNDFTLSGGGTFDGQGEKSWKGTDGNVKKGEYSGAVSVRLHQLKKSIIKDVTSLNSKNFHMNIISSEGVTFQNIKITAPGDSPTTDGIHVARSTGINITDCEIATGDDCISIGDGTKQMTVTNVKCGPGHGISIGSLGRYDKEEPVEGITIKNCSISKTTNGVRIKTWPNNPMAITVSNIKYEDITLEDVENPIIIDQEYCPHNQCEKGANSKIKISDVILKNIKGTTSTPLAVKIVCSKDNPCDKVELSGIDIKLTGSGTLTSQCTNVKPTITNVDKPLACASDVAPIPGAGGGGGGQAAPAQRGARKDGKK